MTQLIDELPDFIPREHWQAFLDMRKSIKKAPTEFAKGLLIKKLARFKQAGEDLEKVLEQSIVNNWTDIYPEKKEAATKGKAAWWTSDELILAEGRKYSLQPYPGENMFTFKGRVQLAISGDIVPVQAPRMYQAAPDDAPRDMSPEAKAIRSQALMSALKGRPH